MCLSSEAADLNQTSLQQENIIKDLPKWGTSFLQKNWTPNCVTCYRSGTWHPPVTVIMHHGGANALKRSHIITTDSRLNSSSLIQRQAIFQGVPRWLSILCKTEKWFCPAHLKLISSGCRLEVESFKIKYWFFRLMSLTKWEEKCMFHTDSFFKTDDKTSFYGAIYSTLTSPTLLRVTKVAFKCPLAQLSEEGLLIQIAFFVWSLSLNAKSQPQTKHIIQGSIRMYPEKRPRPAGDALIPPSSVSSVYILGPVIIVSLISIILLQHVTTLAHVLIMTKLNWLLLLFFLLDAGFLPFLKA